MRVSALNTSGRAKGAEPMNTYEIVTERIINLLEQGEIVVFWKIEDADQTDPDAAQNEGDESARRRFLLRFYRVWNVEQCALPQAVLYKLPPIEPHQHDPIEAAE